MNIGFSPTVAVTAFRFEAAQANPLTGEAPAAGDEESKQQQGLRPVGEATESESARSDNKSREGGEERERKPIEGSAEAKREALKDPNSALSKELQELKKRDREVRAHEQAHLAAAGQHARGGPVYEFKRGPDGQRYAVGGHVSIDTSEVAGDPEATLRKAEVIRRAALAPAEPSPQDRRVAAQASSMAVEARQELAQLRLEEAKQQRVEPESATNGPSESATSQRGDGRAELEGKIRNSGAVGEQTPVLDLVA